MYTLLREQQDTTTLPSMAVFDTWLDTDDLRTTPTSPCSTLDAALDKLASAVAALHRTGSLHKDKSEAFWIFAAGSWSRAQYGTMVAEAAKRLPKHRSIENDLVLAEQLLEEAIAFLRQADLRDADDLVDALDAFREGRWRRSRWRRQKRPSTEEWAETVMEYEIPACVSSVAY